MKFLPYLARRAAFFLPQVLGVVTITFIIVRLIPGDPARLMAGPLVPEAGLELIRQKLGLVGPLPVQYINYLRNLTQGELGVSWYTGNPVATDLVTRLPATMELLLLTLLVTLAVMLPIAIRSVSLGKGWGKAVTRRGLFGYGMAAGAFPDFWLALIMVLIFYVVLGWLPAPTGQLDIGVPIPTRITGMYIVDSLLTGNWVVFKSSILHAILPVFVLAFVYGGAIIKVAIVQGNQLQKAAFVNFAKVCGLSGATIDRYITRATYPSVATATAVTFGFLIGGAVLVETIFSWGGMGQYAVQSVINADFAAIQGVVLVSALINLVVYVLVDLVYFWVDPRIKSLG